MAKRKLEGTNIASTSKIKNIDMNSEENVIKYCLMPSLQHLAITNIVTTLWKQVDLKSQLDILFNEYGRDYNSLLEIEMALLPKIADKIVDKLSQIAVPNNMRKILSNIVGPIGEDIVQWIIHQNNFIFDDAEDIDAFDYIDALVWTPMGVIDYKQTAKTLLAKDNILPDSKYNIACAYCLEDDIRMIGPKVINTTLNLKSIERQAMVYFWTAQLKGEFTELDEAVNAYNNENLTNYSRNECIFAVLTAESRNPVAIKYIWYKLSNGEKSRQVVSAIISTYDVDIACFLLSQISKEQEKQLFQSYFAKDVLLIFFDHWLWGQYFLPLVHIAWGVMPRKVYLYLLQNIICEANEIKDIEKCNQYKATLKELWQYAPQHFKEYVFERGDECFKEELLSVV